MDQAHFWDQSNDRESNMSTSDQDENVKSPLTNARRVLAEDPTNAEGRVILDERHEAVTRRGINLKAAAAYALGTTAIFTTAYVIKKIADKAIENEYGVDAEVNLLKAQARIRATPPKKS